MNRPPRLAGKVALVTGSGRGIGRAIAETFAAEGAKVVVTARTEAQVTETVKAIREQGGEALPFPCDLREPDQIAALVQAAVKEWQTIHILVNNAATFPERVPFPQVEFERWQEVIEVNLFAVVRLTQAVVREMIRTATAGRIINISSINGQRYRRRTDGQTQYNASKAALDNLTKGLAMELAPHGIVVNGIAPGFVKTALSDDDLLEAEWFKKEYLESGRIPLGRYGTPQDCAKLALFLASDDCTWMTGETIQQDGGMNFIF